jgi:hypothetical protein
MKTRVKHCLVRAGFQIERGVGHPVFWGEGREGAIANFFLPRMDTDEHGSRHGGTDETQTLNAKTPRGKGAKTRKLEQEKAESGI